MASISHVFTAARVATMLGVDETLIRDVSIGLDAEHGRLWVYDTTVEGAPAFTEAGLENLRYLLDRQGFQPLR